jgi:hypothetical protein
VKLAVANLDTGNDSSICLKRHTKTNQTYCVVSEGPVCGGSVPESGKFRT